jgi:Winged helix-turn-helix DNA-binding
MMADIQKLLESMDPTQALPEIAGVLKKILPLVTEEDRLNFMVNLIGGASDDKVASMVHLWLAECLDEGVDPTHMCQRLMDRVAQSRQLMAVADPEILVLFEDWLDELENEVVLLAQEQGPLSPADLARKLGLSERRATFLISKLSREGKIS